MTRIEVSIDPNFNPSWHWHGYAQDSTHSQIKNATKCSVINFGWDFKVQLATMFSRESLKYVVYLLRFGAFTNFIPYDWNPQTQSLVPVTGKRLKVWFLFSIICFAVVLTRSVLFVIGIVLLKNVPSKHALFEAGQFVGFSYGAVIYANTVLFRVEVCQFMNQLMKLNRKLVVEFDLKNTKDGLEEYNHFFFINTIVFVVLIIPFQFTSGMNLQNIYMALGGTSILGRLVNHTIEAFVVANIFAIALMYNYVLVGCLNSLFFWLNQITPHNTLLLCDLNRTRFLRRIQIYRGLGLILTLYTQSCAKFLVSVGYFSLCSFSCLCIYIVIKHPGNIGIVGLAAVTSISLMSTMMLYTCLRFGIFVTDKSADFIQFTKASAGRNNRIRFIYAKAVHPLRIYIGSLFYLKNTTFLTTIANNSSYLLNLLLTF